MLSREYGHARQTCARALHLLEAEGMVIRVPGLGFFIGGGPEISGNRSVPVLRVAGLLRACREDEGQ